MEIRLGRSCTQDTTFEVPHAANKHPITIIPKVMSNSPLIRLGIVEQPFFDRVSNLPAVHEPQPFQSWPKRWLISVLLDLVHRERFHRRVVIDHSRGLIELANLSSEDIVSLISRWPWDRVVLARLSTKFDQTSRMDWFVGSISPIERAVLGRQRQTHCVFFTGLTHRRIDHARPA